jgi:UDP-N-acetylglucosamine 3-dehydrogenase
VLRKNPLRAQLIITLKVVSYKSRGSQQFASTSVNPMINTAVIGCGVWGSNHARVYHDIPNCNLVAVVDADEKRAKEIGLKNHTNWFTQPDKVLENPDIQIISVCTPTITHYDIALSAIKAGKNVLVEKPMTDTVEQAQTLINLAKKKNVKLTVGFVERFNPAVQEAIKRVNDNEIGEIVLAHTRRVSRRPERIGDVGVIKDLAIHDIDIINHLFNDKPKTVYAIAGKIKHTYEDYANINITYSNNRNAFVETNWLTPRRIRTLVITGTTGIINVEYPTQEITIENNTQIIQPFLRNAEPLRLELDSFIKAVEKDTEPEVTGTDGINALKICEAAIESSKNGEEIKLK